MKLYIKENEILPRNKIVIHNKGRIIISPTEKTLFEEGWSVYTEPSPTLTDVKNNKIQEILKYDSSDEINIFYIEDQAMWLDNGTRVGLMLRLEAEEYVGKTHTTLWYNGIEIKLPIAQAKEMLNFLETYASACYDNTQNHITNISGMKGSYAVKTYDYKKYYFEPLKLHLKDEQVIDSNSEDIHDIEVTIHHNDSVIQ